MSYIRWTLLFGAIAVVAACTPFLGPRPPDGGGGNSGPAGTGGGRAGGAGAEPTGTAGSAAAPDSGTDGPIDVPTTAPEAGSALNGAACAFDTDCSFSHCVEGVCCESACAGKCSSCRNTNTGQLDGRCAAVKVGVAHGADCTASDPSTCGFDGMCDGAGTCRHFIAGTSCGMESCSDGATTSAYASARTCDGAGSCTAAMTSTCGGTYRCMGTRCKTSCTGPTDCVPGAYCSGTTCVTKKSEGTICSAATECSGGFCGGRCCASGCSCTLPDASNVLKNPGFDNDANGWTIDSGTLSRSLSDAEHCPYSGSLTTTGLGGSAYRLIHQCVGNTPLVGDFNFGGRVNTPSIGSGTVMLFQANFYSGFNCDGDLVAQNETDTTTVLLAGWQGLTGTLSGVFGANSVRFDCYLNPASTTDTFNIDMLYLSKTPSLY